MIIESREKDCEISEKKNIIWGLIVLSIATSIDALAVGITFALINIDIILSALVIGIVTFGLSFLGVKLGNKFGCKYKSSAEMLGGLVLVIIGLKILVEHLFFM